MEESFEKDIHFLDYWRVLRSRKEIILAVSLLVVITATSYTFTRPKIYMANARISIRQDTLDLPVWERQAASFSPFFLRTQHEIIQSRSILNQVIENLNLARKWGELYSDDGQPLQIEDTYETLRRQLKVRSNRETTLIDLEIYDRDPQLAADIANAVAVAYRDRRLNAKRNEIRRGIEVLQNERKKQQEILEKAESELETIRKEEDISIVGYGRGGISADTVRLQRLMADRIDAEVDMRVRKSRLDQVLELADEELLYASNYIARDATLNSIKNALIDTEVNLSLLREQYGPSHPEVKRHEAGVTELKARVADALTGLKKGLRADYEVAKQKFEELDRVVQDVRRQDIEGMGERMIPFQKASRNVDMQREILNALRARVAQEGIQIELPRTPVDIVEPAVPPQKPVSPKVLFNILASIAVGLALGIGMAYFIEYLDTSVKTVDDVEQYLGLPVIGIIPQKVRPLSEEGPDSPHGEAYRLLRTNMQFSNKGIGGGAFAVVSGGVGEGKSTTLFNLAYVCAQLGDKVLIVDSDLRRPVQHTFLSMSNRFGLTNLLMRDVSLDETIKPTTIPNLHFLPSGQLPRAGLGLLDSQRMRDLVKNLKARYDYVFFDAPPLMGVSDASILASEVDGVLLVVQYRKYPRTMSSRAKRVVDNVGGKILGVVLNNINIMRDDYYYYYHTHYSHYHTGGENVTEARPDADAEKKKEEVF